MAPYSPASLYLPCTDKVGEVHSQKQRHPSLAPIISRFISPVDISPKESPHSCPIWQAIKRLYKCFFHFPYLYANCKSLSVSALSTRGFGPAKRPHTIDLRNITKDMFLLICGAYTKIIGSTPGTRLRGRPLVRFHTPPRQFCP